jgi:hypothetical protein
MMDALHLFHKGTYTRGKDVVSTDDDRLHAARGLPGPASVKLA